MPNGSLAASDAVKFRVIDRLEHCRNVSWRRAMSEVRDFRSKGGGITQRQSAPCHLATIVAGNISGYSHLAQIDKEGTLGRVKQIEREVIGPAILEHHGRPIKTAGDGFIAIFDSPFE